MKTLKLLDEIAEIVEQIESELDVHLTDEDFAGGHDEIVHIFLHESSHAALSNRVPWIHNLTDEQHTCLKITYRRSWGCLYTHHNNTFTSWACIL